MLIVVCHSNIELPIPREVDRHRPADESRSEDCDFHFHSLSAHRIRRVT